jgi:hypothetical protein
LERPLGSETRAEINVAKLVGCDKIGEDQSLAGPASVTDTPTLPAVSRRERLPLDDQIGELAHLSRAMGMRPFLTGVEHDESGQVGRLAG